MGKRLVDKDHLKRVSKLPCFISTAGYYTHDRAIQVHHLLKPNSGFRAGVKAGDCDVIPLCAYHHMELHTKYGDEEKFFQAYGMKPDAGRIYAKKLYEQTLADREDPDDDLPF